MLRAFLCFLDLLNKLMRLVLVLELTVVLVSIRVPLELYCETT